MKEQLKYEDARFQKITASYNTVKFTLTALLQNQEPASAIPSTSDSAIAYTLAALQEELQTEKLQRQLLVSGFMSQTAQHEVKVKQLELELTEAKADLELQKQQAEVLSKGKEAVGSLASTSQIQQAETHLHIQQPLMPEMPKFQSPQEEEQPRPAPRALDIREQMEQEVEDMPEGPAKEYLLYKKKVMESAALAFLKLDEHTDFGNDFIPLSLMRHEANLWKEKMRPAVPRNEEGDMFMNEKWSFGYSGSGSSVFSCPHKGIVLYSFGETQFLEHTSLSRLKVTQVLFELGRDWPRSSYDLLSQNCNHFCDAFCEQPGVQKLPAWINHFAHVGIIAKEALEITAKWLRQVKCGISSASKLVYHYFVRVNYSSSAISLETGAYSPYHFISEFPLFLIQGSSYQ
ncbi:hypothetical protein L7F22_047735 [Adiantum nelumboides]|nr:hypothetical protein [Adiantum nelumboides]